MTTRVSATLLLLVSTLLAISQCRSGAVSAAECTATQLAEIQAFDKNGTSACGGSAISSAVSASAYCANPACLAYVSAVASQMPYCDIQGFNVRTVLVMARAYCDQRSNESDAVSYTKQPSGAPANAKTASVMTVVTLVLAAVLSVMV